MLLGVMEGHSEDDECSCGHTAINHSPCCGACMVCGTRICDEFAEEPGVGVRMSRLFRRYP